MLGKQSSTTEMAEMVEMGRMRMRMRMRAEEMDAHARRCACHIWRDATWGIALCAGMRYGVARLVGRTNSLLFPCVPVLNFVCAEMGVMYVEMMDGMGFSR